MKPSKDLDANQASEDELIYGVDQGIHGGDSTALSIKKGSTLYTFVGDEAVAIIDVIRTEKLKLLAEIGEPKLKDAINMKPEQYEGGVIINDWYKNRISKLEAEL